MNTSSSKASSPKWVQKSIPGWKTYTNEKYLFSFQYPPFLTQDTSLTRTQDTQGELSVWFNSTDQKTQLGVSSANQEANFDSISFEEGTGEEGKEVLFESTTVDNYPGILRAWETDTSISPFTSGPIYDLYEITLKDKPFGILYSGPNDTVSLKQFKQILSTVKFTSSSTTISSSASSGPSPTPTLNYFYRNEANDFSLLKLTLYDNSTTSNYYTPLWHWCGGASSQRVLNASYVNYIYPVGTVNSQTAYILSDNTPYPTDSKDIPTQKWNKVAAEFQISALEWPSFLSNQTADYPIIVIKNSSGNLIMYIRQDYLLNPGC